VTSSRNLGTSQIGTRNPGEVDLREAREPLLRAQAGVAGGRPPAQGGQLTAAQRLAGGNTALSRTALRELRPTRPLKLARLLALPLEPVLIDAAHWRSGAVTLPRSALQPLTAVVEAALPELTVRVNAMVAGKTTQDEAAVLAAGALLWPAAAAVLQAARDPPPEWARACLPPSSFLPLAHAAGVCLSVSWRLAELADPTMPAPQLDTNLGAMLRLAVPVQPLGWGMMLALLIMQFPGAPMPRDAMLHCGAASPQRPASDAVLRHLWAWIDDALTGAPAELAGTAAALRRRTVLLHALAGERAHRAQATEKLTALRQIYGAHLTALVGERLIAPLAALTAAPDDGQMARLEAAARGLRRLAADIRGLGGLAVAETVMQDAAGIVALNDMLGPIDRARLVEILDGPEQALRMVEAA
jgi:hypothetical protein